MFGPLSVVRSSSARFLTVVCNNSLFGCHLFITDQPLNLQQKTLKNHQTIFLLNKKFKFQITLLST